MNGSLRALLAGLAAAVSIFVITLSLPAASIAQGAALVLFALVANAWIVAVAERVRPLQGSHRLPRFPLGPRLLKAYPGLGTQFLAFVVVLGVVSGSPAIFGWTLLIVTVVCIDVLRRMAWYVVPAVAVIHTLLNMPEFHTLGDLVQDAHGWLVGLVWFVVQAFAVCGSLLRTDVGAPLPLVTRAVAALASLPGYGAAFWIVSSLPVFAGRPELESFVIVLLLGGILQSVLLSVAASVLSIRDRSADGLPAASARAVGMALLPLLLPSLLAGLALLARDLPGDLLPSLPVEGLALFALLLIAPAVPAGVLVGAGLDALDRRRSAGLATAGALAALGAWFVFGPAALGALYAPGGVGDGLRAAFPMPGGAAPLVAETLAFADRFAFGMPGGELALWQLPAADLCRATTLFVGLLGLLCARALRHARPLQVSVGWTSHFSLLAASLGGAWLLLPRLGLLALPLCAATACALLLLRDAFRREILPPKLPEVAIDEQVFTREQLAAPAKAREIVT